MVNWLSVELSDMLIQLMPEISCNSVFYCVTETTEKQKCCFACISVDADFRVFVYKEKFVVYVSISDIEVVESRRIITLYCVRTGNILKYQFFEEGISHLLSTKMTKLSDWHWISLVYLEKRVL